MNPEQLHRRPQPAIETDETQPHDIGPDQVALEGIKNLIAQTRNRITKYRIGRLEEQIGSLTEDAAVYKAAGQDELKRIGELENSIDSGRVGEDDLVKPLPGPVVEKALFSGAKHRMTQDKLNKMGEAKHDQSMAARRAEPKPRSQLQQRAGTRASLRGDEIRKKRKVQLGFTDIHGDHLEDRKETKITLNNSRNTLSERRETRKIGRAVRRAGHSENNFRELLEKQANGTDTPGKLVGSRLRRKTAKIKKLNQKLTDRRARRA